MLQYTYNMIHKGFKMILTINKIKNIKQAKRAITAIQSAFAITPIVGKEVIIKDDTEALKYKDNKIKVLSDLSKKQAEDIKNLNTYIEDLDNKICDLNKQISDLSNKENDISLKYANLKATYDQLKKSIEPFDLSTIDIEDYIVTPKCCNDVVTQNIMKDGFEEPTKIVINDIKGDLSSLPAPKMDGSLMDREPEEENELIEVKEGHTTEVSGELKTAFENGLEGRVMLDSEEDYIPPKVDFSIRAIPLKVFIRDKEKNISNSGIKNEEIRELLLKYQPKEIESDITAGEYKKMYSKIAKYLNRDTLKQIKKIFLASSSNTVKRAYRKPYYDLLTKIHDIITTDRLPMDDIEPQKEADNTKPIVVDKTSLESDTEAIKASIEAKVKQAINKAENPILTTRDDVFKYGINQVRVAKIEGDDGIPMPFIKVQKLLKDLESFMSKSDILHLLNILIGDDVFRGNTYERYIPNIKYWRVLRGIKKGLNKKDGI